MMRCCWREGKRDRNSVALRGTREHNERGQNNITRERGGGREDEKRGANLLPVGESPPHKLHPHS